VDENSNGKGDARIIDGRELAAFAEPFRGFVTTFEQLAAVYDRLGPGAQRRTLERLYEILRVHADESHATARVLNEHLRRTP
jgi:hypothetical protein